MTRVYVASRLDNYKTVQLFQDRLRQHGFQITLDWAAVHQRELEGDVAAEPPTFNQQMIDAVRTADAVLFLTPGGRGAHVELGVALGANIPVFLYLHSEVKNICFYDLVFYHTSVSPEDALSKLISYKG